MKETKEMAKLAHNAKTPELQVIANRFAGFLRRIAYAAVEPTYS